LLLSVQARQVGSSPRKWASHCRRTRRRALRGRCVSGGPGYGTGTLCSTVSSFSTRPPACSQVGVEVPSRRRWLESAHSTLSQHPE
jgi:hypothetical protein